MTPETVRYFGLMLACQARIEGMNAANRQAMALGHSLPYVDQDFRYEAAELERLALEVIQQ